MKEYQGHRSWNAWNVSLWISNDAGLYHLAADCYKEAKTPREAIRKFNRQAGLIGTRTPDGAVYNPLSIKLALEGLELACGRA